VIGKGVVARVVTDQYANNRIEADQGRLKAGLRPMRGLRRASSCRRSPPATHSYRTCAAATTNSPPKNDPAERVRAAFDELAINF
jgi:hypothetical protein